MGFESGPSASEDWNKPLHHHDAIVVISVIVGAVGNLNMIPLKWQVQ